MNVYTTISNNFTTPFLKKLTNSIKVIFFKKRKRIKINHNSIQTAVLRKGGKSMLLAGVCKEEDNTMESVFILQNNHETCCNVSSKHTLRDSRKYSLIMQHFIMRIGFFLLLTPPSFPLQLLLPNLLPTIKSLPVDSEIVNKFSTV